MGEPLYQVSDQVIHCVWGVGQVIDVQEADYGFSYVCEFDDAPDTPWISSELTLTKVV